MPEHKDMSMSWWRFAAMIATSSLIMFFLMYQLVYEVDHLTFSINRLVASLVMGSAMTVVMLGFMWRMYSGLAAKLAVLGVAVVAAGGLLAINRSQALVGDTAFMNSMIPHHSIAINNARRAEISDPRVRALADEIISSQLREIAEMKLLLEDIDRNGEQAAAPLPARSGRVDPEMLPRIRKAVE